MRKHSLARPHRKTTHGVFYSESRKHKREESLWDKTSPRKVGYLKKEAIFQLFSLYISSLPLFMMCVHTSIHAEISLEGGGGPPLCGRGPKSNGCTPRLVLWSQRVRGLSPPQSRLYIRSRLICSATHRTPFGNLLQWCLLGQEWRLRQQTSVAE